MEKSLSKQKWSLKPTSHLDIERHQTSREQSGELKKKGTWRRKLEKPVLPHKKTPDEDPPRGGAGRRGHGHILVRQWGLCTGKYWPTTPATELGKFRLIGGK